MLRIETFEQFKEYAQKGKSFSQSVTNCYLLPVSIKEMISLEKLYVTEQKDMVLFLEKETSFFRVYYYLSLSSNYKEISLGAPAVVEFVFLHELSEKQNKEVGLLKQLGFSLGRESGRMVLSTDNLHFSQTVSEVTPAKAKDADAVLNLLVKNFNPLYAFIPSRDELLDAIHLENVLVVCRDDLPVGVLFSESCKKTAVIRQLTVSKEYRSHGFAKQLIEAYHQKYAKSVNIFTHWVDISNLPAIKLYQLFGYSFDGRKANEYVL